MQFEFPNAKPPTAKDEVHLQELQALIEKTLADGVLTTQEYVLIRDAIAKNKKLMPEELELVKSLIRDKIATGEVITDLFAHLA
jgi:hypothetical protein